MKSCIRVFFVTCVVAGSCAGERMGQSVLLADTVPAPVAHWRFDEGTGQGVRDAQNVCAVGQASPQVVRVPGIFGQAILLDGLKQSVMVPHIPQLKPAEQISISLWVFPRELTGTHCLYRKEDGDNRHLLAFQEQGRVLAFGLNVSGSYAELDAPIDASRVCDGNWHLITATYDGAAKRVYLDGEQLDAAEASGQLAIAGDAPLWIGSFAGQHEFFAGYLDDVRLYNVALTGQEIVRLYREGSGGAASSAEQLRAVEQERSKAIEAAAVAELDQWHDEAVAALRPFQPQERARWAMDGFMVRAPRRLAGPEGFYRTVFDCSLLPRVRREHARWDLGDCTARAILSWTSLRKMTGDADSGHEVERGQLEYLLAHLHPETGLVYYAKDGEDGPYRYQIWDQSRTLRALVCWYRTEPDQRDRSQPLVDRMIAGLERFATLRGTDPQWGDWLCWPSDEFADEQSDGPFSTTMDSLRGGLCIEPLVDYAELTGNQDVLNLAVRYANCVMGNHAADNVPPEKRAVFQLGPDGSIVGHFHCKTTSLIGIAKLALLLAEQGETERAIRYAWRVRRTYDWILDPNNPRRGSRIGWMPERPGRDIHETCCVADAIELAVALAQCAAIDPQLANWVDLYDDAEAMTVNVVARTQVRFTDRFRQTLRDFYEKNGFDPDGQLREAQLFEGLMPAVLQHNDMVWQRGDGNFLICGGCCMYSGVRALHAGWRNALRSSAGHLEVNYFMNRQSAVATMTTQQPVRGEAEIVLHAPAEVQIRIPGWLEPDQMECAIGESELAKPAATEVAGRYLRLGPLAGGARIRVRFPLDEKVTAERFAGRHYWLRWRGNYLVQMAPREALIPFFDAVGP